MYRRTRHYQYHEDRMTRAWTVEERKRLGERGHHPDIYPPELSKLRSMIVITDFESSTPVTHCFELYRTSRINCYSLLNQQQTLENTYWLEPGL